jgi:hypothetical protein
MRSGTLAKDIITLGWGLLPTIITTTMAIGQAIVMVNCLRGDAPKVEGVIFFFFGLSVSAISWLIWYLCN